MTPPIGIAHLTLLRLSPPELVSTAAAAGYDFVGIRVNRVTATERQYPMQPGSPMSRETVRRLADTGLTVRDVEFLTLGPKTGPADWRPALEAGAALGARTLSVVGTDPDRARLADTLARLTVDARELGIVPTLEPISYQPVSRVAEAAALARAAGAAVLLDALHIQRGGSDLDEVRALEPGLVPCVQLCDGPLATPESIELPERLPMGMTADGSPRHVESRVQRQLVGEGEFPLAELLGAVPAGTPISVEVPHAALQSRTTPAEFARLNLCAVRHLLARVETREEPAVGERTLAPVRHRVALLGAGIGSSLSPALHLREAAELGLDYHYELLDLKERPELGVRSAVHAGYTGLNVTHPVKQTVLAELDELAPDARRLGAVNTVVVHDGRLIGHNTDHSGFLAGLRHGLPGASLRRVLVVGARGAGSAVGYALLRAGARVRVTNSDPERGEACAARLAAARPDADVAAVPLTPTAIAEADGVVNATPIGMVGHPGLPFDPTPLTARHWVAEVVYRPLHTELLVAARAVGCRVLDGGAMLVAQAAGTLALLTGARPDLDRMRRHLSHLTLSESITEEGS